MLYWFSSVVCAFNLIKEGRVFESFIFRYKYTKLSPICQPVSGETPQIGTAKIEFFLGFAESPSILSYTLFNIFSNFDWPKAKEENVIKKRINRMFFFVMEWN
jgi:hypothetical protein